MVDVRSRYKGRTRTRGRWRALAVRLGNWKQTQRRRDLCFEQALVHSVPVFAIARLDRHRHVNVGEFISREDTLVHNLLDAGLFVGQQAREACEST